MMTNDIIAKAKRAIEFIHHMNHDNCHLSPESSNQLIQQVTHNSWTKLVSNISRVDQKYGSNN